MALGRRALLLIEIGKLLAFFRQALQKRTRLPKLAVLLVEFFNAVMDFFQTDGVGIPHRPTAIGREAVAVQVNDVDIDCTKGIALLEDARAFVDKRIDAAIDDFFPWDFTLPDTRFNSPF